LLQTIEETLAVATEHHRAGRTTEAERLYQEILGIDPGHGEALHLMGVLAFQAGRAADAVGLFTQAIASDGQTPMFHTNLGHALHALGRREDAARAFANALVLLCRRGAAVSQLGAVARFIRRYDGFLRHAAAGEIDSGYVTDDSVRKQSLLFHIDGDVSHYRDLADAVLGAPDRFSLPALHHIVRGMMSQLFVGATDVGDAAAFQAGELYRLYELLVSETARRLQVAPRLKPAGRRPDARRIVLIATPPAADGDAQPVPDIHDCARQLQDDYGREVTIVNAGTLALSPESGFMREFAYSAAEPRDGMVTMERPDGRVRVASFAPKDVDAATLQAAVDFIEDLDPDIVIAFGAGNVVADLFAGTRAVVCVPTAPGLPFTLARLVLGYDEADDASGWPAWLAGRFRPFSFGWHPTLASSGPFDDTGERRRAVDRLLACCAEALEMPG
jgi:tetratricopeptide (TPR) repeat protein